MLYENFTDSLRSFYHYILIKINNIVKLSVVLYYKIFFLTFIGNQVSSNGVTVTVHTPQNEVR